MRRSATKPLRCELLPGPDKLKRFLPLASKLEDSKDGEGVRSNLRDLDSIRLSPAIKAAWKKSVGHWTI
jgi:hypothetical protein